MEELKENQQRLIEFMEIGDYITLKKELNEENPANIAELFEELIWTQICKNILYSPLQIMKCVI